MDLPCQNIENVFVVFDLLSHDIFSLAEIQSLLNYNVDISLATTHQIRFDSNQYFCHQNSFFLGEMSPSKTNTMVYWFYCHYEHKTKWLVVFNLKARSCLVCSPTSSSWVRPSSSCWYMCGVEDIRSYEWTSSASSTSRPRFSPGCSWDFHCCSETQLLSTS